MSSITSLSQNIHPKNNFFKTIFRIPNLDILWGCYPYYPKTSNYCYAQFYVVVTVYGIIVFMRNILWSYL